MDIGADLEGSVQSRDESDLMFDPLERLKRGRQLDRVRANRGPGLRDRAQGTVEGWQDGMPLAREEAATHYADRHIVEAQTLRRFSLGRRRWPCCYRHAFEPRQGKRDAACASEERSSGRDSHQGGRARVHVSPA